MSILPDNYEAIPHEVRIRKNGVPMQVETKHDVQKMIASRKAMEAASEVVHLEKTRPIEDYLTNKVPMQSDKLKVRLIKEGVLPEECHICKNKEWQGQKISLELDHINGDHGDNQKKNLRLICPNCHAQTSTYRVKKKGAKSARDLFGG